MRCESIQEHEAFPTQHPPVLGHMSSDVGIDPGGTPEAHSPEQQAQTKQVICLCT